MDKQFGLSEKEVRERQAKGQVNRSPKPAVKSYRQIICEHTFNLFNAYNFCIALALVLVKAWTSLFFVVIVSSNTFLRIYQEIKSRNMVAKLNLIISPKTKVVREGKELEIDNEEIVLDDVICLKSGMQIAADCVVLDTPVEVDESLLSGEAEPILKEPGDHMLSGSFLLSGACHARVEHVGIDNYATKIADETRKRKPVSSEMVKVFSKVTRMTSCLVLPLSALLFFEALVLRHEPIEVTVVNTSTALLGMLPVGLVLLASISMMASVVRLGKMKVVVQEMFSIETLSHADTLCLDKTGTLTQGKMKVQSVVPLGDHSASEVERVMTSFVKGSLDSNATFQTLAQHFQGEACHAPKRRVSFSSARKWSALELESVGTLILGAPEFILPGHVFDDTIEEAKRSGARVLLAVLHPDFDVFQEELAQADPFAAIVISDPLREDAQETIRFFQENEVDIKIISGDHPMTVAALAKEAGVADATRCVDATTLKSDEELERAILENAVIGRATPQQKHKMILTLQRHGRTVAMTGDGVNDVLALKDADVSIAMGSGSDAAKQISQFVVINGDLKTLAEVVKEGRLDTNNVTRSASMYYLKTIYTILISIIIIFLNMPYPFIPFQMTLLDNFVAGFPSFMILFERNIERQKESIGRHALRYSLPNALAIVLTVLLVRLLGMQLQLSQSEMFTILYFSTSLISIHMIYRIYCPLNWYRGIVLVLDIIGFVLASLLFWDWLELAAMDQRLALCIVAIVLCGILLVSIIARLVNRHLDRTAPFGPGGDTVASDPAGRRILKTILRRFQRERVRS